MTGHALAQDAGPVLLVCSSGGHLLELLEIAEAIPPQLRHWVTFDRSDARALLRGETVTYAHAPTNRNVKNLVRNAALAFRLTRRLRPRSVISTGAGVAVPFLYAARLLGARPIYVESLARIDALSLTGRLVSPAVRELFVQWPELAAGLRHARFEGAVVSVERRHP